MIENLSKKELSSFLQSLKTSDERLEVVKKNNAYLKDMRLVLGRYLLTGVVEFM